MCVQPLLLPRRDVEQRFDSVFAEDDPPNHLQSPVHSSYALVLEDRHGPVRVYPLPYSEPAEVRRVLGDETVQSHPLAMHALLARVRAAHPAGARSVLVAHAFVVGGEASESERPFSVGGADRIEADVLEGFVTPRHRKSWTCRGGRCYERGGRRTGIRSQPDRVVAV